MTIRVTADSERYLLGVGFHRDLQLLQVGAPQLTLEFTEEQRSKIHTHSRVENVSRCFCRVFTSGRFPSLYTAVPTLGFSASGR